MNVTMNEAINIILSNTTNRFSKSITLDEAVGEVLAQDIYAKYDIPKFAKSAIDGYTFAYDTIDSYPATLKIIGESRAGVDNDIVVKDKEAVFTMTGALVPKGADTAVRVEDVIVKGDSVTIQKAPKKGDLINLAGSEIKSGDKILSKNERLDYRKVALLANIGVYTLKVYTKPKIGIVVTGNEVKEPWQDGDGTSVRNSNLYILKGMLREYADVVYYGRVDDDASAMAPFFQKALRECDILLSSGGASKGKYDFTVDIASKLNLDVKFTTTNIRPGRPLIFATKDDKLFFGLPGYPSALLVNALIFLLPALKKMIGLDYNPNLIDVIADDELKAKVGRNDFIRVNLIYKDGKIYAKSAGSQQTSNYLSMALCDGLAVIAEDRGSVKVGEIIKVLKI